MIIGQYNITFNTIDLIETNSDTITVSILDEYTGNKFDMHLSIDDIIMWHEQLLEIMQILEGRSNKDAPL